MPLALIAACSGKKQVIGNKGLLPWHFSADMQFFKQTTAGHPVLMGRVTYASILKQLGKPLPGRQHLVITRDRNFIDPRVQIFYDIPTALASQLPQQHIFVIGGQQIYEQTLPLADKVYLTHIEKDFDGDAFFPPLDPKIWQLVSEKTVTEKDVLLRFCEYSRQ
jgi:dihydrofolate reductase